MYKTKECPKCGILYLKAETCTGGDNACHEPAKTIDNKERRLDLEKAVMANKRGEHNGA